MKIIFWCFTCMLILIGCEDNTTNADQHLNTIRPKYITEATKHDSDDPAIWIHPTNPALSLILGTDKDEDGALYVYNLEGKIIQNKVIRGLKRPNNIDVAYGLETSFGIFDIAIVSERLTGKIRIFSLPNLKEIDGGGIAVYVGEKEEEYRDLMGIAAYHDKQTNKIYVIPGRKNGPKDGTYLWQYELFGDQESKTVKAKLVRKFGQFSGKKEIEAIAVDNELGFIYYSDETIGIRKYHAKPSKGNEELALFGTKDFTEDNEGISIYKKDEKTGYILISDQQRNTFNVYPREGALNNVHKHKLICRVPLQTIGSDGNDVTPLSLNKNFKTGLFVAMSESKVFHYYQWEQIEEFILKNKSK